MTRPPPTIPARRAVTLLEVLVTVAVSVLLTLIVIVSIRGVRGQTLAMRDLHNLRLSGQDLLLWSADNDDEMFNVGLPGSTNWGILGVPPGGSPESIATTYWGQQSGWNVLLAMLSRRVEQHWQSAYGLRTFAFGTDGSAPGQPEPGTPAYAQFPSRFRYSPTFLTIPEMWRDDALYTDAASILPYFATVRTSQVRSPGAKAVLINFEVPDGKHRTHFAFVDGGAGRFNESTLPAPAPHPLAPPGVAGIPGMHTINGHAGADR